MQKSKKARVDTRPTSQSNPDRLDKTLSEVVEVQRSLDKLADEMSEKGLELILQLNQQYSNLRSPYYTSRTALLRDIPMFWKTVFIKHPVLSSLLTSDDEDVLDHMTEVNVKEFEDTKGGFTLEFVFSANNYFSTEKLVKVVKYDSADCMVLDGSPPSWREGMEPIDVNEEVNSQSKRRHEKIYNFFMWFGESGTMENGQQDELSLLIRDDIWPNPLKYFKEDQQEEEEREVVVESSEQSGVVLKEHGTDEELCEVARESDKPEKDIASSSSVKQPVNEKRKL